MRINMLFPGGKTRALTFSYDDPTPHNMRLADIFNASGFKCTFNICAGMLDAPGRMTSAQVKELYDSGHEIACHGATHPFYNLVTPASALEDVLNDRCKLEEITGSIVRGMAYPEGVYSAEVKAMLHAAGIAYCRTVKSTGNCRFFPESGQWLEWHPSCHHTDKLIELGDSLLHGYGAGLRIMYVWGHAFEFANSNNWELMEQFCNLVKDHPDIWYATNMEIHDYVEAFRSLVTSADSRRIFNPTTIPVFFGYADKIGVVAPGETLSIDQ